MIDGASRPKAVRLIIVPLALPGVIAVSIFTFIVARNDYLFARVLIGTDSLKTLPVGIQDLYESTITDWGTPLFFAFASAIPSSMRPARSLRTGLSRRPVTITGPLPQASA